MNLYTWILKTSPKINLLYKYIGKGTLSAYGVRLCTYAHTYLRLDLMNSDVAESVWLKNYANVSFLENYDMFN